MRCALSALSSPDLEPRVDAGPYAVVHAQSAFVGRAISWMSSTRERQGRRQLFPGGPGLRRIDCAHLRAHEKEQVHPASVLRVHHFDRTT